MNFTVVNLPLVSLQIELTSRCNERCVHCYIPHENKNCDMDSELLFGILDQCRELGVKQIAFSGGEPMMYKDFWKVVDKADWYGFDISIFSNLTLLPDEKLPELKTKRIKEVQSSVYSVDPAVHDSVTQCPGSCEKTKAAVKNLWQNSIPVFISCPVMKQNKDSYTGVLKWSQTLRIRSAPDNMITAPSNRSDGNLQNRLDIEEALQVIHDILENDTAYDAERCAPDYHNTDDALPCVTNICKNSLCVNAEGIVLPSPGWNYPLGDLRTQTLPEIWENSPEIKRLQNLSLNDFPKCQTCPDVQFCGMSLEGNANENPEGNPFIIPEHICTLARKTREVVHGWKRRNNALPAKV
jgi:radical SAM protein with 4Fe4S-binding SPASM domain